jgi:multiple sugar transport system permease protein
MTKDSYRVRRPLSGPASGSPVTLAFRIIFIAGISFIIAFPFIWMLSNSIKTKDEIWAVPPQFLPAIPQWINFTDALADGIFFNYMWNSVYTSVLLTLIVVFNSAMFAYAITQIHFKGKNFLFALVMVTYIMPPAATYVPSYIILGRMNIIDTHMGYIISSAASIFNIFYFRQIFMQVPKSVTEAARIDGAGHWSILWRIVTPMTVPAFATLAILSFVTSYNSYLWPSLVLKSQSKYMVSMGLRAFFSNQGAYGLKWGTIMASCVVVIVPLLIVFAFGERWIERAITSDAAVKE